MGDSITQGFGPKSVKKIYRYKSKTLYGIPELNREEIKRARVIANPGCYSSAAILGTAPLVKQGLVDTTKIIVDGL